jgi:hypothetical protein
MATATVKPGETALPTALRASLLREFVSGAVSLVVAALFLLLVVLEWLHAASSTGPSGGFNGVVLAAFGVVMGYTFTRISAEARAEHAERSAASAEQEARAALREAAEYRGALETLVRATSPIVEGAPALESVTTSGATRIAADYARLELAVNLTREHLSRMRVR